MFIVSQLVIYLFILFLGVPHDLPPSTLPLSWPDCQEEREEEEDLYPHCVPCIWYDSLPHDLQICFETPLLYLPENLQLITPVIVLCIVSLPHLEGVPIIGEQETIPIGENYYYILTSPISQVEWELEVCLVYYYYYALTLRKEGKGQGQGGRRTEADRRMEDTMHAFPWRLPEAGGGREGSGSRHHLMMGDSAMPDMPDSA